MMFEKFLKRLCPCYYSRSDESDLSACTTDPTKASDMKQTSGLSERVYSDHTLFNQNGTTSSNTQETWKGTVNLVQPQPVYAFPVDLKKPKKRNQKSLLKPPLYWKKTMKNLHADGPPVFQDTTKNSPKKKSEKNKLQRKNVLKHSGTVTDIASVISGSTVEVRWLKSQSLDNIAFDSSVNDRKRSSGYGGGGDGHVSRKRSKHRTLDKKKEDGGGEGGAKDWNCLRCHVLPDISHGVILFTAAYFNKKKMCLINIDRLENLSKKGREGNTYHSVVKLAILPSEKYIKCTKVLSNCSNPEVREDFSFSIKELTGKVLRFSVFDASLQKQHEAVGHACLHLEDIVSDQPKKYRIKLYRRTQPHVCPGNLSLSLNYEPDEDKFTIAVDKGRNFSLQRDKNVKLNTYIKVTLYSYGEKVKTKKSLVIIDSRDPNYNSTFTFQVRKDQTDHLSVTVAVRLKGFVNDMTIGRLNFGPFFYTQNEMLTPWGRVFLNKELVSHWFRMYL